MNAAQLNSTFELVVKLQSNFSSIKFNTAEVYRLNQAYRLQLHVNNTMNNPAYISPLGLNQTLLVLWDVKHAFVVSVIT